MPPSKEERAASDSRINNLRELPHGSRVHISGICGTGTSAVAKLLKDSGYYVTGSDKAFYPPIGNVIREIADEIYEGYSAANLSVRPDFVIIGNAIRRENPEAVFVFENDIPFASMPEAFSALLIGTRDDCPKSVVISGTHGKTTSAAATATMFDISGRKPGYFIGGVPRNLSSGLRKPSLEVKLAERVVVLEGDEYDSAFFAKWSKFHSYRPDIVVITSLEFDHADIYESLDDIIDEFSSLLAVLPKGGSVLVNDASDTLIKLADKWTQDPEIEADISFYGEKEKSKYQIISRKENGGKQHLELNLAGEKVDISSELSGLHNAMNLLAAAAVGSICGLSSGQISESLGQFSGVLRRQTVLGEFSDVLLIEDFAHHPSAVSLTLEGLRERYPDRRLVALFEPRSNTSRRAIFHEQYTRSLSRADEVVIVKSPDTAIYNNTGKAVVLLDSEKLASDVCAEGANAVTVESPMAVKDWVAANARKGDLLVLMSNGSFGGLPQVLPDVLAEL